MKKKELLELLEGFPNDMEIMVDNWILQDHIELQSLKPTTIAKLKGQKHFEKVEKWDMLDDELEQIEEEKKVLMLIPKKKGRYASLGGTTYSY